MKENILAKRYAEAIYMISEEKKIDYKKMINILSFIDKEIKSNDKLLKIIKNPNVLVNEKIDILNQVLKEFDEEKIIVDYLLKKDRLIILDLIISEFINIYNQRNNVVVVNASFAIKLTDEQKSKLKENLEKKLNKKVDLKISIDKSIIGGGIVNISDEVIDGSYKTQLLEINKLF